jgi:O-antigen/teichoic acid export membrane protein
LKIDFRYFSNRLLKSELIRGASVLITGTVIAQLISVGLRPYLTRIFSTEIFGAFEAYLSMIGILTVVTTLRYDDAIVLPKTEKESVNVLFLSLTLNLIINLVLFLVILIWGKQILILLNIPSYFPISILYLIPLSVFLFNTYQSFNFWLIRRKKYYSVSINKMIRRGFEGISQLTFGLLKNPKGLIFSDIIGQSSNVTAVLLQSFKSGLSFKIVSIAKVKYVLKKYSDFPKYNLLPSLMSTCSFLLPPIFINTYYSSESAGFYSIAKLVLSLPMIFVTSSISSVLLQKVAEKYNRRDSFLADLNPIFFIVGVISIFEILLILFLGESLFRFVFGNQWIYSGKISKILVWSFTFNFIVSTFTSVFISMRKIKIYSFCQLIYFLAIMSLLLFMNREFIEFLKLYVFIEVVYYAIVASAIVTLSVKYERSLKIHV